MNVRDCTKIAINPKYIRKVFSIRYRLNTVNIIRSNDKYKAQVKNKIELVLDYTTLSRT